MTPSRGLFRRAVALAALCAAELPPGIDLDKLSLVQVHQVTKLADELAQFPDRSITDPGRAVLNLYGNWSLALHGNQEDQDHNLDQTEYVNYLVGTRVQVRGGRLFYRVVPDEENDPRRATERGFFYFPAGAALLSFLSQTLAQHPNTPDVDVTFPHSDFCFGVTRKPAGAWGHGPVSSQLPEDRPPPEIATDKLPPVFHWSTSRGAETCDAVTTTSYDWSIKGGNATGVEDGPAWSQRAPILGWRGSLMGTQRERARLVHAGLRNPNMDLKLTGGWCDKYVQDAAAYGATREECSGAADVVVVAPPMPYKYQQNWKFIVDVDGGGSTWRLKNVLRGGWVVFKVESERQQFWYSQLVPFVHYIPVSLQNLEEDLPAKLEWALAHDKECEQIMENGRKFAREHLSREAAHWQQHAALKMYSQKLAQPIPNDPDMALFCCRDVVAAFPHLKGECHDSPGCDQAPARPGLVDTTWLRPEPARFATWGGSGISGSPVGLALATSASEPAAFKGTSSLGELRKEAADASPRKDAEAEARELRRAELEGDEDSFLKVLFRSAARDKRKPTEGHQAGARVLHGLTGAWGGPLQPTAEPPPAQVGFQDTSAAMDDTSTSATTAAPPTPLPTALPAVPADHTSSPTPAPTPAPTSAPTDAAGTAAPPTPATPAPAPTQVTVQAFTPVEAAADEAWEARPHWKALAAATSTTDSEPDVNTFPGEVDFYAKLLEEKNPATVCETGFDRGYTSLVALLATRAHVYSFDLGGHGAVAKGREYLDYTFPGRLTLTIGDSVTSVRDFMAENPTVRCDFVLVDGGHAMATAHADLMNFYLMRNQERDVTVVIDDTPCTDPRAFQVFCGSVTQALQDVEAKGFLRRVEARMSDNGIRGVTVATYARGSPQPQLPASVVPVSVPDTRLGGLTAQVERENEAEKRYRAEERGDMLRTQEEKYRYVSAMTPVPVPGPNGPYLFKAGWNTLPVVDFLVQHASAVPWDHFAVNFGAGDGVAMIPGSPCEKGPNRLCADEWEEKWPGSVDPTYRLFTQRGFKGLAVEGDPNQLAALQSNLPGENISKVTSRIMPGNVEALLKAANAPKEMDFFKNDIDSFDCAVTLAAMDKGYRPKVVQVEVNPDVPYPVEFGVEYSQNFKPGLGAAGFYGCSLSMTSAILRPFGYILGGVGMGHDSIWIRADLAKAAGVPDLTDEDGSKELGKCCLTPHWGQLGGYAAWSELNPVQMKAAVERAAEEGCKLSQGTTACEAPFATDAAKFIAATRAELLRARMQQTTETVVSKLVAVDHPDDEE